MKTILCLSDSLNDIKNFTKGNTLLFFQIEQLDPNDHSFPFFENIYQKLKNSTDLSKVDLIIAEYIEAIPLIYFMRKDGFFSPAIFIPHTNAYPFNIFFYFLLISHFSHPEDCILCGSMQAAKGYTKLININALPICTFGIKNIYQLGDKSLARKNLGLEADWKYLLYTGRFMNDKGLLQLIEVYDKIRNKVQNVRLILCLNHIDTDYYNRLAPRLRDCTLFYRLNNEKMQFLYQSVDLFVSTAISIFETYGKSPLEAIASGIPAILPKWDGFSYFISPENGALANVFYTGHVEEAPYSFAIVDENNFVEKCLQWLQKEEIVANPSLPDWAYYDHTMVVLSRLVDTMGTQKYKIDKKTQTFDFSKYPEIVKKICSNYALQTTEDIEIKAEQLGLINRENPGDLELLQELHDMLFKTMDSITDCIVQKEICTV